MNIAFPKLSSLVWPGMIALSLIGLFYLTVTTKIENSQLKEDISQLQKDIKAVKETNTGNTVYYVEAKSADQQLIKDSGRKQLLFEKPGLIEIKINKSFDDYMREFDK
ncbi:hypothetical protein JC221_013 [Yersinia phage JC221]|nr:hypothetical protein JC221_013 [Yersinia phage JC221]